MRLLNTERARGKVRQWFKRQDQEQNISNGRAHFEREIRRLGILDPDIEKMAKEVGLPHAADIYEALGNGDISMGRLIAKLNLEKEETPQQIGEVRRQVPTVGGDSINVVGLKGLLTHFGTLQSCSR